MFIWKILYSVFISFFCLILLISAKNQLVTKERRSASFFLSDSSEKKPHWRKLKREHIDWIQEESNINDKYLYWEEFKTAYKQHGFEDKIKLKGKTFQLLPLVEFITQRDANLLPEKDQDVNRLLNSLADNEIDNFDLYKTVDEHLTKNRINYWNNFKKQLTLFANLRTNYGLTKFLIDDIDYQKIARDEKWWWGLTRFLNDGNDVFNRLKELESETAVKFVDLPRTETKYKNVLWIFRSGVKIAEINKKLTILANTEKTKLWDVLQKHRQQLTTFLGRNDLFKEMVIGNNNYRKVFRAFVAFANQKGNKTKTFNDLTSAEKEQLIQPLFDEGINKRDINELLTKLENKWKTVKTKKGTQLRNGKKTILAIGLGVGLGVPVAAGISYLLYWFLKVRKN